MDNETSYKNFRDLHKKKQYGLNKQSDIRITLRFISIDL